MLVIVTVPSLTAVMAPVKVLGEPLTDNCTGRPGFKAAVEGMPVTPAVTVQPVICCYLLLLLWICFWLFSWGRDR